MMVMEEYDEIKMRQIEENLLNAFCAQDETDDVEEYFTRNAPQEYLQYISDCQAARRDMEARGIRA